MFARFRKHKWLWVVIFSFTIISFVAFFSPQQQYGWSAPGSGNETVGSVRGRPISRDQYVMAYREAELRYLLSYGDWPRDDEFARQMGVMDRETRNRLLLAEKLRELNIQVNEPAVAEWIVQAFQDREQKVFRKEAYDQFVKERLEPHGISQSEFEHFVRSEVGIQHLVALTGLSGRLIPPQEAEILYRRENEQADVEAVFLITSNYLANVTVDPAALAGYYTNQQATYRIPERVQVDYVKFEATNFLAEADLKLAQNTNLNQLIEMNYQQRGPRAFLDVNNQPLPAAEAKKKIHEEVRTNFALVEARKKAIEFASELLELPPQTNNLANLAAAKGFVVQITEPFGEFSNPPKLNVPETFAQAAFKLTAQAPIHEQPIVAEDGVYVVGLNRRVPSELPPLESIQDKVTEDYRKSRATELANSAGAELHTVVTNKVAQGKTFAAACLEANLIPIDLPPFSQKTPLVTQLPNRADLAAVKNAAFALDPGEISNYTSTREGGFILLLQAKLPVAEDKLKTELAAFVETLRRSKQYEAFGDWLRRETELAQIVLPTDKKETSQKETPQAN